MGSFFSRLWNKLFGKEEVKLVMVGLNNAGKTTILYRLHLGEVIVTEPTLGSNMEKVQYKNITFVVWDLAGQEKLRRTWKYYYEGAKAVVLVVDSSDKDRIDIVQKELFLLLENENLAKSLILVFANKQDLRDSMDAAEITEKLKLHEIKTHDWHIQGCCALSGEGISEGLDWIAEKLK